MKSPFLALLLIANLLACPLRCVSFEASAADGERSAVAACTCCSHPDDVPVSDSPEPDSDCNCQDCLCEGAVVEADVELPEPIDAIAAWGQPLRLSDLGTSSSHGHAEREPDRDRGLYHCGRDARIAHQSLLI